MLAGACHPEALFLQALHGACQVGHLGHLDVGDGTRAALIGGGGHACAALVGDDHARCPHHFGGTDDGAQVARVGDVVQDHDQGSAAFFRLFVRGIDQLAHTRVLEGLGLRHDALVAAAFGLLVQVGTADGLHGQFPGLGLAQDVLHQAIALQVICDQHALQGHPGAQRFDNGSFPFDVFSH